MTEAKMLEAILREELMDDYEFDALAETLIEKGVHIDQEKQGPEMILFSSYAHKEILKALVDRCIEVCREGSIDDAMKLSSFVLAKTEFADFKIADPGLAPYVDPLLDDTQAFAEVAIEIAKMTNLIDRCDALPL